MVSTKYLPRSRSVVAPKFDASSNLSRTRSTATLTTFPDNFNLRHKISDDFWYRYLSIFDYGFRRNNLLLANYNPKLRIDNGLPFTRRYDYPYRFHHYNRYPLTTSIYRRY